MTDNSICVSGDVEEKAAECGQYPQQRIRDSFWQPIPEKQNSKTPECFY